MQGKLATINKSIALGKSIRNFFPKSKWPKSSKHESEMSLASELRTVILATSTFLLKICLMMMMKMKKARFAKSSTRFN